MIASSIITTFKWFSYHPSPSPCLNNINGAVQGKPALRDYFTRGLKAYPDLRFKLAEVLWGVETIVVCYTNNVRDSKSAEVMQLTPAGKVCRVWANYDK